MPTSQNETVALVRATDVRFVGEMLELFLSDGRRLSLPFGEIEWLGWLAAATPEQRANWSLEPDGYAVYWEDLDDGIEVMHVLDPHSLA